MNKSGLMIIVSGPSGAGKGTICKQIIDKNPNIFLSVSATTRPIRSGEVDGVTYYYLTEQEFKQKIEAKEMLEWAIYADNYYGTMKDTVFDRINSGQDVILEIDVQGAMKIRAEYPEAVFVFILPPSADELKHRLIERGRESLEQINKRLEVMEREITYLNKYNYVIVNDNLDVAVKILDGVILAEKARIERNKEILGGKTI